MILAVILGTGCDLLQLPYFLYYGVDPKQDPQWVTLADTNDTKREVKVAVLVSSGVETRPEFIRVDRELTTLLTLKMQKSFEEDEQKVTFVSPRKIEKFKDDHPGWSTMELPEIGKFFDVDFVIFLDIESMSLHESGSHDQLFYGRASITINVFDKKKPEDYPVPKQYVCEFPKSRGPIPVSDGNLTQFRLNFLDYIATHVSWYFTTHRISDDIKCES